MRLTKLTDKLGLYSARPQEWVADLVQPSHKFIRNFLPGLNHAGFVLAHTLKLVWSPLVRTAGSHEKTGLEFIPGSDESVVLLLEDGRHRRWIFSQPWHSGGGNEGLFFELPQQRGNKAGRGSFREIRLKAYFLVYNRKVSNHNLAKALEGRVPTAPILPPNVIQGVQIIPVLQTAVRVARALKEFDPPYVSLKRHYGNEILHYVMRGDELLNAIGRQPGNENLLQRLGLREEDSSGRANVEEAWLGPDMQPRHAYPPSDRATTRRTVIVEGDEVLGIVPSRDDLLYGVDLPRLELRPWQQQMRGDFDFSPEPRASPSRTTPPRTTPPRTTPSRTTPSRTAPPRTTPSRTAPPRTTPPRTTPPRATPQLPALPASPSVLCHFLAEMETEAVLGQISTVTLQASLEELVAMAPNFAEVAANVTKDAPIIVDFIPKKNVEPVGETRVEFKCPKAGSPVETVFDFRPLGGEDGIVQLRIRQGSVPLARLQLTFKIVSQKQLRPRRQIAESKVEPAESWDDAPFQLRIVECYRRGATFYRFEISSEPLVLRAVGESPDIKGNLLRHIKALYRSIEMKIGQIRDFAANEIALRAQGAELYEQLVPLKLREFIWEHRDKIQCIQVFSEEPYVPWELLHVTEPGGVADDTTRYLAEYGLVRWLDMQENTDNGAPTRKLRVRKGHAYHVIPLYPLPNFSLEEALAEVPFLEQNFGSVDLPANQRDLHRKLADAGAVDFFHFAGHGDADFKDISKAGIKLKGENDLHGKYHADIYHCSTIEHSAALVGTAGIKPIIMLNACRVGRLGLNLTRVGGFAKSFILRGAGLFVGAQWSVGDRPARVFTEAFYSALLEGETVAAATIKARASAREKKDLSWLSYAVYGHPEAKLTLTRN